MKNNVRVAVAQAGSICFDKQKSIKKVHQWMTKAAEKEVKLILFPEAFISCYPRGMNFGSVVGSRSDHGKKLWQRYYNQSVDLTGDDLKSIAASAAQHKMFVSLGIVEKDAGTLYCTQVLFTPGGKLAGIHRKIKPTGTERTIWGEGDGSTLTTFKTQLGTIGTLTCWENYMPLARMALYRKGVNIYLAPTADQRENWQTTVKHIATEGRCFVLTGNQFIRYEDYPDEMIEAEHLTPEISSCRGGSAIISPSGEYLAGPLFDKEGLLVADLDMDEVIRGKMDLDVAGHYNRPDVFRLEIPDQPDTRQITS